MSNDAYLGNPNLKKVNTPVEFTKDEILEYQMCSADHYILWKIMFVLYH